MSQETTTDDDDEDDYKGLERVPQIHIVDSIHHAIAIYQMVIMLLIVIMGLTAVPFLYGPFFIMGAPAEVNTSVISSNVTLLAIVIFLMFDRFVATIAEELGSWSSTYDLHTLESPNQRYARIMINRTVTVIIYWLRYNAAVMFMRSQLSFVLAIVVTDMFVYVSMKSVSMYKRDNNTLGGKPTDVPSEEKKREVEMYRKTTWMIICLQILEIPMIFVVFQLAGLGTSEFFTIGPGLVIFDNVVDSPVVYIVICLASFLDQFLASLYKNVVDDWHMSYLQNPLKGHGEILLSRSEAIGVFVMKRVMMWVRIMFVIQFMVSQFFFSMLYIAADLCASLPLAHINYKAMVDGPKSETRKSWNDTSRFLLLFLSVFQAVETILIVEILTIPQFITGDYFSWLAQDILFDNLITEPNLLKILHVVIALDRIGATCYNDVIIPDYANWLYGNAYHVDYSNVTNMFILASTRFVYWFRFLLLIQFVLSNVSFIIISAAIDIPLGLIIMQQYIVQKDKKWKVRNMLDFLKNSAPKIQQMWTAGRFPDRREKEHVSD